MIPTSEIMVDTENHLDVLQNSDFVRAIFTRLGGDRYFQLLSVFLSELSIPADTTIAQKLMIFILINQPYKINSKLIFETGSLIAKV